MLQQSFKLNHVTSHSFFHNTKPLIFITIVFNSITQRHNLSFSLSHRLFVQPVDQHIEVALNFMQSTYLVTFLKKPAQIVKSAACSDNWFYYSNGITHIFAIIVMEQQRRKRPSWLLTIPRLLLILHINRPALSIISFWKYPFKTKNSITKKKFIYFF